MAYFSNSSIGESRCVPRRACGSGGLGETYLPGGFGQPQPIAPPRLFPPRISCETARAVDVCLCPVTQQEILNCRIRDMFRTPLPPPPPRRSISELVLQRLDEAVDSVLRRWNIPPRLRPHIRSAARGAVQRLSTAALEGLLDRAGVRGEPREAIIGAVRAAASAPVIPVAR
jgi:hypothetical protein